MPSRLLPGRAASAPFTKRVAVAVWMCLAGLTLVRAAAATPDWTCNGIERFLRTATVGRLRSLPVGVTIPSRATLDDGTVRHEAAIQTVDISATRYETFSGTELNFRDSWKFNVAGYELAKLLGLNMVPPYVERTINARSASVSWWIPNATMERDRLERKLRPPDLTRWNREMYAVRVFHELIGDRDFNATNVLIAPDWRIWMIDFTRAFRRFRTLHRPEDLVQIDRTLLRRLRELDRDVVREALSPLLMSAELDALLERRAALVGFFDAEIGKRGETAVLYDFARVHEPCGTGLD
jgi:hypothetical protein